jgi:hypothetical protein
MNVYYNIFKMVYLKWCLQKKIESVLKEKIFLLVKLFFLRKGFLPPKSGVGKSIIVAALCRIFTQDGYKVAPFKSQNMALNSYVTADGLEIGRAQAFQAFAASKEPTVEMNPILLKPTSDTGAQVIIRGKPIGNMTAKEYHDYKPKALDEPYFVEANKRYRRPGHRTWQANRQYDGKRISRLQAKSIGAHKGLL